MSSAVLPPEAMESDPSHAVKIKEEEEDTAGEEGAVSEDPGQVKMRSSSQDWTKTDEELEAMDATKLRELWRSRDR